MLRVGFISPFPRQNDSPHGGVEAAMVNLYEGFKEVGGVEAVIIDVRPDLRETQQEAGALGPIFRVPSGPPPGRIGRSRRRVLELIRDWNPDLVHSQGIARLVPTSYPSILTVHGFIESDAVYQRQPRWRSFLQRRLVIGSEIRSRNRAENVIAISRYSDSRLPTTPRRRLWHIPNAVHHQAFSQTEASERTGLLYAGRITELKGVHVLIKAMSAVVEQRPKAKLTIAGPGLDSSYGIYCRKLSEELGLDSTVQFIGSVERPTLYRLIAASECVTLASFVEVAPIIVSEALALGTPVIATRVGALPEMVGPSGRLVEPGSSDALAREIVEYLRQPVEQRTRCRLAAAEEGRQYSPTRVAALTKSAYQQMLGH